MKTLIKFINEKLTLNKQSKIYDYNWINLFLDTLEKAYETSNVKNVTEYALFKKYKDAFYNSEMPYRYSCSSNSDRVILNRTTANYANLFILGIYDNICSIMNSSINDFEDINFYIFYENDEYVMFFMILYQNRTEVYLLSNTKELIDKLLINVKSFKEIHKDIEKVITIKILKELYGKFE